MPIEPPIFKVSSFVITIRAYDLLGSEYQFEQTIRTRYLSFGTTTSLYALKLRIANNVLNEYVFYNSPYATSISEDTYYADLKNITAKNSTLKLQETKTISYISLTTKSSAGTTSRNEITYMDLTDNNINSGYLFNKLYNKKL